MKQKVGIIIDSLAVDKQIFDFIELSRQSENYEITTLVLNQLPKNREGTLRRLYNIATNRGPYHLISSIFFKLILKIEAIALRRHSKFSDTRNFIEWICLPV